MKFISLHNVLFICFSGYFQHQNQPWEFPHLNRRFPSFQWTLSVLPMDAFRPTIFAPSVLRFLPPGSREENSRYMRGKLTLYARKTHVICEENSRYMRGKLSEFRGKHPRPVLFCLSLASSIRRRFTPLRLHHLQPLQPLQDQDLENRQCRLQV